MLKVELLEESFQEVVHREEEFVDEFYARLFTMFPEIQLLFKNTDMEAQRKKLIKALVMIVETLRKPEALEQALKEIGERHENYGVRPEHFLMFGEALLNTFETLLGSKWTPEVKEAWADAYDEIARLMCSGYRSSQGAF